MKTVSNGNVRESAEVEEPANIAAAIKAKKKRCATMAAKNPQLAENFNRIISKSKISRRNQAGFDTGAVIPHSLRVPQ